MPAYSKLDSHASLLEMAKKRNRHLIEIQKQLVSALRHAQEALFWHQAHEFGLDAEEINKVVADALTLGENNKTEVPAKHQWAERKNEGES